MHKKNNCLKVCVLQQSDITLRRCNKSTLAIVLNPRFDNVILSYAHKLISLQYLILSLCCLGMISVLILKFFHLNLFSHGTFICHCLRKNHHDLKYHQYHVWNKQVERKLETKTERPHYFLWRLSQNLRAFFFCFSAGDSTLHC